LKIFYHDNFIIYLKIHREVVIRSRDRDPSLVLNKSYSLPAPNSRLNKNKLFSQENSQKIGKVGAICKVGVIWEVIGRSNMEGNMEESNP
jgi:hypothetical protein